MSATLLVTLQIVLIVFVLLAGSPVAPGALLLFQLAAIFLAASAYLALRPHTFRVSPEPKPSGRFTAGGPYRWIRHPMYTSVLLFTGPLLVDPTTAFGIPWWARGLGWLVLGLVLILKIRLEERLLSARYPEYDAYRARTKRLVPFVW
ncbi:MAG: DUF1295 domain-containing protein [Candidatus Eisenbacteria bacterium]